MFLSCILVWVCLFFSGTSAYLCRVCTVSTQPSCTTSANCGVGNGCYSQSWITNGVRYYERGCHFQTIRNCYDFKSRFCTRNDTLLCCDQDNCNTGNPETDWKPERPNNFQAIDVTSASVTLKWDIQCNGLYTYQLLYSKQGGAVKSIEQIPSNSAQVTGLDASTAYLFTVRALYDGVYSDGVTTAMSTNQNSNVINNNFTICVAVNNVTLVGLSSFSTVQRCPNFDDVCFLRTNHWSPGDSKYWTKGCATQSSCLSENSLNSATCRPGTQGSSCTYCCEGANCNVGDITAIADFTCDNVSVTDRIECGWSGITQVDCFLRGCCYLNAGSVYDKWCYHTKYVQPSTTTTSNTPTTTPPVIAAAILDYWIIIVIVLAILILILIVALIAYCVITRKREKKRGFYECESVYAKPNKNRGRVRTTGNSNPAITIEEAM
uniref:uncharacterized protein LOC108949297 n=1 Tax=Ciona intestinalis TaxID=7719 RepID=UPI00089DD5E5|nr:uncharacterized protein LOC108949297 [Ciona intestinalis]|eukprot:XP_018667607.1 uncharacterized protein LOC108949297 [Ciona intestinalis]